VGFPLTEGRITVYEMSDEGIIYLCEGCRQQVDPRDTGIVRAVEMHKSVTMGPSVEWIEGLGVFFHEHCFPASSVWYRRKAD
jgi:hypothetical protein